MDCAQWSTQHVLLHFRSWCKHVGIMIPKRGPLARRYYLLFIVFNSCLKRNVPSVDSEILLFDLFSGFHSKCSFCCWRTPLWWPKRLFQQLSKLRTKLLCDSSISIWFSGKQIFIHIYVHFFSCFQEPTILCFNLLRLSNRLCQTTLLSSCSCLSIVTAKSTLWRIDCMNSIWMGNCGISSLARELQILLKNGASCGETNITLIPDRFARAVRPLLWTYSWEHIKFNKRSRYLWCSWDLIMDHMVHSWDI